MRVEKEQEVVRLFNIENEKRKAIEQKLDGLKADYNRYKGISSNDDIIYQKLKRYYALGVEESIKQKESELLKQNKVLIEKREELKEKQIERKTVEILRDKKKEAFIKEENRLEQINFDELSLYAYIRNNKV